MEGNMTEAGNNTHHRHYHSKSNEEIQNHHHFIFHSNSILIIVIISIIISVFLLVCIFLFLLMLQKLKSAKKKETCKENISIHNTSNRFIAHTTINVSSSPDVKGGGCLRGVSQLRYKGVQVFTYKELEVATQRFSEGNVIGNGGIGIVYRGVLSDGTVAAIKMLHQHGKQRERAFRMEVDLLSGLQSPRLVELLGYCADQHHRLLIYEFMPNYTLHHHLHHSINKSHHSINKSQPLDWGIRLSIALDCARALEFLHEHAVPSVIHRNFNCTSVLLDHSFRAKLSDFGLAKMGSDKVDGQISTRVLGTTGYVAPEYASTGKLTTKSDVYSYGVVLLELLTGRVPVDIKRPPGEHVLVSWALPRLTNRGKLEQMVDPAMKGQYSKKDLVQVAAIAAMCVQPEADYRPLMTDVVQSLIPLVKNLSSHLGSSRLLIQTPSPRY